MGGACCGSVPESFRVEKNYSVVLSGTGMYWECFTAILGGVVGLKGAGHGGADLKWAGHVVGVSLSHLGSKKFTQCSGTQWYSVVLSGTQWYSA
jgi:hypothetical protein